MNLGKDIIENGTVLIPVLWIPSIMANDTAGHGWWTRCRGEKPAIESSVLCGSFRRNDYWYPIAEKKHHWQAQSRVQRPPQRSTDKIHQNGPQVDGRVLWQSGAPSHRQSRSMISCL